MKKLLLALSLFFLIFLPVITGAQSEEPTFSIGYSWQYPGDFEHFVEDGGVYLLSEDLLEASFTAKYEWTGGGGVTGELYQGELHNADRLDSHFMPTSPKAEVERFPAHDKYFVVIRNLDNSLEVKEWFEKGASTTNPLVQAPSSWGIIRFELIPPPPPEPDPIIIIPGILGSWEKNGEWTIDPVFHTYNNLIETLRLNGLDVGGKVFPFPYDWRESNVLTSGLLRDKISEVQDICECEKVDIVAHSMGGLIARHYIQSSLYEGDVDQLIFLGTPHRGAPKVYLTWEAGESIPGLIDSSIRRRMSLEAFVFGFEDLFDYVQNRPVQSIQDLLPTFEYLKDAQTGLGKPFPDAYPENPFLISFNSSTNINRLLTRVRVTNIVGDLGNGTTLAALRVVPSPDLPKWEHGYPKDFDDPETSQGLEFGRGDGTVPLFSASWINRDLHEVNSEHRRLVDDTQGLVYEKLIGSAPDEVSTNWQIPNALLFLKILSPADIQIIAPDGKRAGRDFEGGEVNEIEGAFYSGFLTDDEYITISDPLDGEYKIVVRGTGGGGEYTLAVGYMGDDFLVEKEVVSEITTDKLEESILNINEENPEDITLEVIKEISLEEFIERIEQAFADGLITDEDFKNSLINKTQSMINSGGSNFDSGIKVLYKRLDTGLESGFVTEAGYTILKEALNVIALK